MTRGDTGPDSGHEFSAADEVDAAAERVWAAVPVPIAAEMRGGGELARRGGRGMRTELPALFRTSRW